jgi:hypothetical protein
MFPFRVTAALSSGFMLSFLALGVLRIGTPLPMQSLMFFPFAMVAAGIDWLDQTGKEPLGWLILCGARPIGLLFIQFRDANDSHAWSIALVALWAAGVFCGSFLARHFRRQKMGLPG